MLRSVALQLEDDNQSQQLSRFEPLRFRYRPWGTLKGVSRVRKCTLMRRCIRSGLVLLS